MRQIGPQPSDLVRSNRGPSDLYEEGTIVVWKKTYVLLCSSDSFQVNTLAMLCARSVEALPKVHDRKLSDRDRSPTRLRSRPSSRQESVYSSTAFAARNRVKPVRVLLLR